MPVKVYSGQFARQRILEGALELARAVGVTYGPKGRNVALDRPIGRLVTKDGVTVAYEVQPEDPLRRIGARTLLQACTGVRDEAGDGTTSTAILAAGLLRRGHKAIAAGVDPMEFARGAQKALAEVTGHLHGYAVDAGDEDTLRQVALIASNGDTEIAEALASVCMMVGKTGQVSIEDGRHVGIEVEQRPGFEWDCGAESDALGPSDGTERRLDVCLVALVPHFLETFEDVASILEEGSQWPHPIVIIARRVAGVALSTMVRNQRENEAIECCGIRASRSPHDLRDNLDDLAALTGAKVADPAAGRDHKKWDPEWFGTAQGIVVRQKSTSLVSFENDEADDRIMARVRELTHRRDRTPSDYERDQLEARIAKLTGGFAVMKVGGVTEIARKERRGRIEDALGAVQGALREGVLPGAGISYLRLQEILQMDTPPELTRGEAMGWDALADALEDPLRQLAHNAGAKPDIVIDRVYRESNTDASDLVWWGWDVQTGAVRSLLQDPLVADPLTQVRAVLRSAVSVATTLLTVETALVRSAIKSGR